MNPTYDVAIIGGGPAGSTCGTLLKKFNPRLKVLIIEREKFPRDHVGESQLPLISEVLAEMEAWDKVERVGFPIKIGATYRWGRTDDLWDFDFLNGGVLKPAPRPGKYDGQRLNTAFQVDRAIYDKILLDHAWEFGCDVRQETRVVEVLREGDKVTGLQLDSGETITAKHYVDASGHSGILRRTMGVEAEYPTSLQNIAIWDYWENAKWAVNVGVGGTRVQVMSLDYGWIWFIPLGPTRTSIGLVIPAEYYKRSGKKPQQLYDEALASDPVISHLIQEGKVENDNGVLTTKDWSFLAERLAGENWFLAGESAGFADPILAAGMTLAHTGARDVAYTILALERGDYEPEWLKQRYNDANRHQILNHIRFADFWYTANGHFSDLKEFTRTLAGDMGLEMSAEEAWRWFGQGGFITHDSAYADVGGYSVTAAKAVTAAFTGNDANYLIAGKTRFKINLEGAEKKWGANLAGGRISRHRSFVRDGKYLPNTGMAAWLIGILKEERTYRDLAMEAAKYVVANNIPEEKYPQFRKQFIPLLEAMVSDGWVEVRTVEGEEGAPDPQLDVESFFHLNRDIALEIEKQPV